MDSGAGGTGATGGYLRRGTPDLRRASLALFVAGLATFAMLYCTQALLPTFSSEFGLSPATASLSLSVATATLAFALVPAGSLSEARGRTTLMTVSLASSSVLMVLAAFSPDFGTLLVVRAVQGVALAGLPVAALAYLAEEVHPEHAGFAVGLYIAGNSIGGLSGRVLSAALADAFSWRVALGLLGVACVLASLVFHRILPRSRRFRARPLALGGLLSPLGRHLADRRLLRLYLAGALLMGSFVAVYNYVGYHLLEAPYRLSQAEAGWIFVLYLVGTFSSAVMGRLADGLGRGAVMLIGVLLMLGGAGITMTGGLATLVAGVGVLTFGFFGAHTIASAWVGREARTSKAQASALYLLLYYLGSSIGGSAGGFAYAHAGWPGLIAMVAGFLVLALLSTVGLMPGRGGPGDAPPGRTRR